MPSSRIGSWSALIIVVLPVRFRPRGPPPGDVVAGPGSRRLVHRAHLGVGRARVIGGRPARAPARATRPSGRPAPRRTSGSRSAAAGRWPCGTRPPPDARRPAPAARAPSPNERLRRAPGSRGRRPRTRAAPRPNRRARRGNARGTAAPATLPPRNSAPADSARRRRSPRRSGPRRADRWPGRTARGDRRARSQAARSRRSSAPDFSARRVSAAAPGLRSCQTWMSRRESRRVQRRGHLFVRGRAGEAHVAAVDARKRKREARDSLLVGFEERLDLDRPRVGLERRRDAIGVLDPFVAVEHERPVGLDELHGAVAHARESRAGCSRRTRTIVWRSRRAIAAVSSLDLRVDADHDLVGDRRDGLDRLLERRRLVRHRHAQRQRRPAASRGDHRLATARATRAARLRITERRERWRPRAVRRACDARPRTASHLSPAPTSVAYPAVASRMPGRSVATVGMPLIAASIATRPYDSRSDGISSSRVRA